VGDDGSRRPFTKADLDGSEDQNGRLNYSVAANAAGEAVLRARPGQIVTARVSFADQIGTSTIAVHMPAEPGGTARVPVCDPKASVALIRVLDRKGAPFAGQPVCLNYGGFDNTRTDAQGRLYIVLGPQGVLVGGRSDGAVRLGPLAPATATAGAVVLDLPKSADRLIDLGTVQLAEEPVLAAGQVVDAAGAPVPYAKIAPTGVQRRFESWCELPCATCDGDGRFVLRGLMPILDQIDLCAREEAAKRYGSGLFDVGARNVRIVVQ
jgi:hypothetical protein